MEANDDLGFVLAEVNGNGVDPGGVPGTVSGAFEAQMDEDISADSDVEAEIEDVLNMRFPNESNLQRDVLTIEFLEAQLQRMINNVGDSGSNFSFFIYMLTFYFNFLLFHCLLS